ncbi:DNA mismatch endonuclease Vsr [Candidatus Haliotispira prima]|uniref:Cytosine-specific methyltransferase n=1 Tax=Candidatus Haliotispira prima TaxID=3034016 RepID=A0ABY8MGT1_9SPIO|nr:DNA mismatch endonuclease Vsr [Candidatus Haliotispira prima]
MDRHTKEQRRKNMQAIKSRGSKIETLLGKSLWAKGAGYRYRKHCKDVFGKPDFVLRKYKIAIFCDSEYFHGKDWETAKHRIKTNTDFWHKKIEGNIQRDQLVNETLKQDGWRVIRFWGEEIRKDMDSCLARIETTMRAAIKEDMEGRKKALSPERNLKKDINQGTNRDTKKGLNTGSSGFSGENIVSMPQHTHDDIHMEVAEETVNYMLFEPEPAIPFPAARKPKFTFIDLFAGIGGFRIAMQNLGGKCLYTSEWDAQAKKTYRANFGDTPYDDITKEETKSFIPDGFDVLCAGFPCQAFSIAGHRGGFEDTRGTLFFDVAEIIRRKQPKAILLENVKGLVSHCGGKTLETILNVLRNDLHYFIPEPQILNAKNFGVPQNRERIFIVGFRKDLSVKTFTYPKPSRKKVCFRDVKEPDAVSVKYYLSDTYLDTLVAHKERHKNKGNGFGYEIIPDDGIANAVVCGGMGRERNLVYDHRLQDFTPVTRIKGEVNRKGIRKMTPREWAKLQGFPDHFIIPVADASAYRQFGNSVAVPAVEAVGRKMLKMLA